MDETMIDQLQADASALDIKITVQEIALYLSEKKVPPEHLGAINAFMTYLRPAESDCLIFKTEYSLYWPSRCWKDPFVNGIW